MAGGLCRLVLRIGICLSIGYSLAPAAEGADYVSGGSEGVFFAFDWYEATSLVNALGEMGLLT